MKSKNLSHSSKLPAAGSAVQNRKRSPAPPSPGELLFLEIHFLNSSVLPVKMTTQNHTPLGLIAGKGKFPLIFAQEAKKNGRDIVIIALKEEMNENLEAYAK